MAFVTQVSENASDILSGVTDLATSVTQGVGGAVTSVSLGVGGVVHNVSAELKRLVFSPPTENDEEEDEGNSEEDSPVLPTPNSSEKLSEAHLNHNSPINLLDQSLKSQSESVFTDYKAHFPVAEDYFSKPELYDIERGANTEELEVAIERCKGEIFNCEEATSERRASVHKLIQLRLCLERAKEEAEVVSLGIQIIQGHQFSPILSPLRQSCRQFCDKCTRVIWNVIHVMYRCTFCGYQCHGKCVKSRHHRKCPEITFKENQSCILKICPEIGLSTQNFRCAECHSHITNNGAHRKTIGCLGDPFSKANVWGEPRLCDYTGKYFCPVCHWNDRMVSPARIIHNWDFEEQAMSQQAKQYLCFLRNKPIFNLEQLNPHLFKLVEELNIVKKLRGDIMLMKPYIQTCKSAQADHLLLRLEERQHFVENTHMYSLKDLTDLHQELLIVFLEKVHQEFGFHIKESCEVCKGKGFICELCPSTEVIFPFDNRVSICENCSATFHQDCFLSASDCPRCLRQLKRKTPIKS